ncbi:MAG: hypothetical protein ACHQU0_02710 [Candidatus Paceibacteria bacterium]
MAHHEGMRSNAPQTNSGERGSVVRAGESSWTQVEAQEKKEKEMQVLVAKYESLQNQIAELNASYEKGAPRMLQEENPRLRELAMTLGTEIMRNIEELTAKKKEIEEEIMNAGGNPNDYTVQ